MIGQHFGNHFTQAYTKTQ